MIESEYFKVSQNGEITATSGKIGGFTVENLNSKSFGLYTKATQQDGIGTGVGLSAST